MTTIFAVSSGRPPAAIGIIRISGPAARDVASAMAGALPPPRVAQVRLLRDEEGLPLDRALLLFFPGPNSATGEDLVELHCHGGRAVLNAVEARLARAAGVRRADPGEFTRRALMHGRIDLSQAEGLADLLEAESETQRVWAMHASEGRVAGAVRRWLDELAGLSAQVEALLDFSDEDDVRDAGDPMATVAAAIDALLDDWRRVLRTPDVDRLRDGLRIVLAGPPNAGKSTLLNAMVERDAAIVSPIAGTTRDRIEVPVSRSGLPYLISDTAGLTDTSDDAVERIGIDRARAAIDTADILLWLGDAAPPAHRHVLWVHARSDMPGRAVKPSGTDVAISAGDAESIHELWQAVDRLARGMIPQGGDLGLRQRHGDLLRLAVAELAERPANALILAEQLRRASGHLAGIIGINTTEAMLDALFGRFCLGK